MAMDEETMRAVLHLPKLTMLLPGRMCPSAWPMLPQLPLLRRLWSQPSDHLSSAHVAALSRCTALVDLTFMDVCFLLDDLSEKSMWAELLSSVPHLRRLNVVSVPGLMLPILPLHVPLLEHLVLSRGGLANPNLFATIAHPHIRLLELGPSRMLLVAASFRRGGALVDGERTAAEAGTLHSPSTAGLIE
jgi:hypothetical protein